MDAYTRRSDFETAGFGTAISIIVIVTGVVYFSGAPGKLILTLAGIGLLALLIVFGLYWYAGMPLPIEEHWIDRIVSAFNPEKDPLGLGYQVLQSEIAIEFRWALG